MANNNGGDPQNRLLVPGDALHSVVLQRVGATNGFSRMPPLGSNEIDAGAVALLTAWIEGALAERETFAEWRLALFGSDTSPEGESDADPDGDGATNWAEYLAGTAPFDGASLLRPQIDTTAGLVTLEFPVPENRSFQIETSTDLTAWSIWDVPGNDGVAWRGGPVVITAPLTGERQFFRLRIWGN